MSTFTEQPLPKNIDAEKCVIGAILQENSYIPKIQGLLRPDHFFLPQHQIIFREILAMAADKQAIDPITIAERLSVTGKLEAAGGIAYVSSVTDGIPRIVNVESYARIVHEKYELRDFAKEFLALHNRSMRGLDTPQDLRVAMELLMKSNGNGNGRPKLKTVDVSDFLTMELRPIEFIVEPVIPVQGLVMIYAKRGRGKTFFMLTLSYAITCGVSQFGWAVPRARRVVYVDGEMPANVLQRRLQSIMLSMDGRVPDPQHAMKLITPDLQEGLMPNIASGEGQRQIEEHLQEGDFLVLDNLSALSHGGKENEGESWDPVQEWLLRLRQRMISVGVLHHAGKGGTQRGTSKREDLLDTVIALREPADYSQNEGARFEVHFEKLRRSAGGDSAFPFELKIDEDPRGKILWLQRPLKEIIEAQCKEMIDAGLSDRDISDTLHISRFQLYRLKKKIAQGKLLE